MAHNHHSSRPETCRPSFGRVYRYSILAVVLAVWPNQAFAAGGTETAETWLGLPIWVWQWGNLVVFWGALSYLLVPRIKSFLIDRGKTLASDAETAASQRAEADEMRRGLEEKIEQLRADMDGFLERNEAEGERERQEIRAQAEADRDRLLAETRSEIAHRFERARRELLANTTRRAAAMAETELASDLRQHSDSDLFARSLKRLEEKAS